MGHALKTKEFLTVLSNSKTKRRRDTLIDIATKSEILAILEIVLNLLQGHIRIPPKQLAKLKHHQNHLRQIIRKGQSLKKRKNLLKQKGGILSAILPLALSTLSSIIPAIFQK